MKKYLLRGLWFLADEASAFQTQFIVRHAKTLDDCKDPALSLKNNKAIWAIISAALVCENLMLAFRAYGYDSWAMEGFAESD